ncbi:unnamed protein product, partial [marine sediment metagenome]
NNNELKKILTYHEKYNIKEDLFSIEIFREKSHSYTALDCKMYDIESVGKIIYKKNILSKEEIEAVKLVFIQVALMRIKVSDIFITQNKILLKKRLWLESHIPGSLINIYSLNEAQEIMDLFSKYQNKYYISENWICNKGYWYWLSFRQKIPNFHVGDPFLNAFSRRFLYLLESLDEIGFQYYLESDRDTMDTMMYHFNYFIILISGIFDSLAIKTKNKYGLSYNNDKHPSTTSLYKNAGKDFLKALRDIDPKLHRHRSKFAYLINLIHEFRELLIHREMLDMQNFTPSMDEEKHIISAVEVNKKTINLIKQCGDKIRGYDNFIEWGVFNHDKKYFISPYYFAKKTTRTLIEFSNKYLELLGYCNFIDELQKKDPNDHFVESIRSFETNRLGF